MLSYVLKHHYTCIRIAALCIQALYLHVHTCTHKHTVMYISSLILALLIHALKGVKLQYVEPAFI